MGGANVAASKNTQEDEYEFLKRMIENNPAWRRQLSSVLQRLPRDDGDRPGNSSFSDKSPYLSQQDWGS